MKLHTKSERIMEDQKKQEEERRLARSLRSDAEKNLALSSGEKPEREGKTQEEIVCELDVHQIELEMQNEALRKTQLDLEEARDRYEYLYDFAPVGYFTFDQRGIIKGVNLTGAALLGVERKKLLNRGFGRFVDEEDLAKWDRYLLDIHKNLEKQTCELLLKREDGSSLYANLESAKVNSGRGTSVVRSILSDITLRKLAEEKLRKAYDEIDLRVKERTAELAEANQQLLLEIEEHKTTEESLQEALQEVRQLKNQLSEENLYLKKEFNLLHSHEDIVGNSEAIRTVLMQIEQVAGTESTVLIQGKTGTGKELVANAIHGLSSRKNRLMIKVNCAALPPTLIESELFGREKGAYTGALSKQSGRFELADTSTIFLDEIDALPLDLQAKLLRVLESGEFERLGSPRTVKVDVRIISATNRDLGVLVSEGRFREDLYYRLNVFQITVPPLHERQEDILPLVWSFVQEFSKRMGKRIESIPQKSVEALQAYPWPGNVRELKNVTERAMIITTGPVLHLDVPKIAHSGADQRGTLKEIEKQRIIEALNTTGWQVSGKDGAAEILGINSKTLESRMQRLGIQRNKKST